MDKARQILDCESFSFGFDIGISEPAANVTLSGRDRIVRSIVTHYAILGVKAQLDQLIEGLKVLGIFDMIKAYPHTVYSLLQSQPEPMTATCMIDLFQPRFSEQGSNKREKEEEMMMYWIQMLELIGGKMCSTMS